MIRLSYNNYNQIKKMFGFFTHQKKEKEYVNTKKGLSNFYEPLKEIQNQMETLTEIQREEVKNTAVENQFAKIIAKTRIKETPQPSVMCDEFVMYKDCIIEAYEDHSIFRVLIPKLESKRDIRKGSREEIALSKLRDMGIEFGRIGDAYNFIDEIEEGNL
jgi:hypothetical protein